MIRKFKVVNGVYNHFGIQYKKDEVVGAFVDLTQVFKSKFTEVDGDVADSHLPNGVVVVGKKVPQACVLCVGTLVFVVLDADGNAVSPPVSLEKACSLMRMGKARAAKTPEPVVLKAKAPDEPPKDEDDKEEANGEADEPSEDEDEEPDEPEEEEQPVVKAKKKKRVIEDEDDTPPRKKHKAKKRRDDD